jgi:hypothetical protein
LGQGVYQNVVLNGLYAWLLCKSNVINCKSSLKWIELFSTKYQKETLILAPSLKLKMDKNLPSFIFLRALNKSVPSPSFFKSLDKSVPSFTFLILYS